jgi:2-polyprenyl-3-methyl-5-hydroxy-6-metoxy-1,4-benzoquinol methylase
MRHLRVLVVAVIVLASIGGSAAQSGPDKEANWNAFIAWFKTAPMAGNPLAAYADKLKGEGKAEGDVKQTLALLTNLLAERSDWIGIHFDKVFSRPITGEPAIDLMSTQPSALLVASIKGLKPGAALDGGMGLGRNAVYLAKQGWTVTGFDVSEQALVLSRANAQKAGVQVTTVKATYDSFDFGSNRWDLIVLAFAWAPVTDPTFVARLRTSLRPGGRIVFEHTIQNSPGPRVTKALMPSELRACFSAFAIASYEETIGLGDWGGPGTSLVRMVAVKQ